ncbi:MAG TPA: NUDIX hydrolase [Gemmatimonadaceae bacterium]|nr:NUDIX hydrolase [Gemmatimonadaceae bacterium]
MPAPRKAVRTETQTSAGGVAYRRHDGRVEVALISVGNPPRWQLPKGLVDSGETPEVAAIREVREEAGIEAELIAPLEKVEYWYQAAKGSERVRYHKFVNFYLMRYLGGDVGDHDYEVIEARWFPIDDATSTLAFKSERSVLDKAVQLLSSQPAASSPGQ